MTATIDAPATTNRVGLFLVHETGIGFYNDYVDAAGARRAGRKIVNDDDALDFQLFVLHDDAPRVLDLPIEPTLGEVHGPDPMPEIDVDGILAGPETSTYWGMPDANADAELQPADDEPEPAAKTTPKPRRQLSCRVFLDPLEWFQHTVEDGDKAGTHQVRVITGYKLDKADATLSPLSSVTIFGHNAGEIDRVALKDLGFNVHAAFALRGLA